AGRNTVLLSGGVLGSVEESANAELFTQDPQRVSQMTSVPPGLTFTSAKRWKSMSCQRLWPKWLPVTQRKQRNCGPPAPQAPWVAAIQPAAAGVPQNAIPAPV